MLTVSSGPEAVLRGDCELTDGTLGPGSYVYVLRGGSVPPLAPLYEYIGPYGLSQRHAKVFTIKISNK